MSYLSYDITFCSYSDCPFKDCECHLSQAKQPWPKPYISVADYSGTCRRYIGSLVDEQMNELFPDRRKKNGRQKKTI